MARYRITIGLLIGLIVIIVYAMLLGSGNTRTAARLPVPSSEGDEAPADASGRNRRIPAPPLSLITADGRTVRLADLKGKVVLIDFWATWCGPCRMSIPFLQKLYEQKNKQGFVVLGVSVDQEETARQVPGYIKAMGMTYPAGLYASADEVREYQPNSIPSMFLLDRKGRACWHQPGYAPAVDAVIARKVDELLKEPE